MFSGNIQFVVVICDVMANKRTLFKPNSILYVIVIFQPSSLLCVIVLFQPNSLLYVIVLFMSTLGKFLTYSSWTISQ